MFSVRPYLALRSQCDKLTVVLSCTMCRHLHISNVALSEIKPKRNIRSKLHNRKYTEEINHNQLGKSSLKRDLNVFDEMSKLTSTEKLAKKEYDTFGTLRVKSLVNEQKLHVDSSSNRSKQPPRVRKKIQYSKTADEFGTLADNTSNAMESLSSAIGSHNERFPDDEIDASDRHHIRLDKYNRRHKSFWYDRKIKEFGKEGKIKEAIDVLEDWMLVKDRSMPTAHTFTSLIGVLGRVGYTKKAFKVFNDMKKMGLAPGDATYTALFNACSNSPWLSDGLSRADQLRELMKVKGFEANLITYHSMIKTYGVLGQLQTAFALMDELVEKHRPTVATFSFLLMACISDKQAGFKHAIEVWRLLKKFNLYPDLPLYNLLIRAARDCNVGDAQFANTLLTAEGRNDLRISASNESSHRQVAEVLPNNETSVSYVESEEALVVHDEVVAPTQSLSLPNLLDEHSSNAQIISVGDLSKPENRLAVIGGAKGLLESMAKGGIRPNIQTFSQLFRTSTPSYEAESDLIKVMKVFRVKPDVVLFNELIHRRCSRGELDTAKRVLKMIYAYGLLPDMKTFGCLAMTCTDRRSGMELLDNIDKAGLSPNIEILGTLSSVSRFDFVYKLIILERVEHLDLKPNDKFIEGIETTVSEVKRRIVHSEQNQSADGYLMSKYFQHSFQEFMVYYNTWLKKTQAESSPNPWEQFRTKNE